MTIICNLKIDLIISDPPHVKFLPSATKLRRLCFHRRVSVHRGGALVLGVAGSRGDLLLGGAWSQGGLLPGECLVPGGLLLGGSAPGNWYPSMH